MRVLESVGRSWGRSGPSKPLVNLVNAGRKSSCAADVWMVAQTTREIQNPRNAAFFRPRSIEAPHLRYSYFDASYSGSRAGFVGALQFFERCVKARGGWLPIFELRNH